tara:strand:- start:887 stop:1258 length:372 start_codon:yes stop_codon:yes gene_type:complete
MNITKQRLEQLIKEEYTAFLDNLSDEERADVLFENREFKPPADAPMSIDRIMLDDPILQEDGHEDVPSAVRAMKAIIEDAEDLIDKLNDTNGNLPTWWTNKMAVAVHSLNKMRDYLVIDSEEE